MAENQFYSIHYLSPVGLIMLASNGKDLIGLWIEQQKYFGDTITEKLVEKNDLQIFTVTKKWLDRYFSGQKPSISDLPLAPHGGTFRTIVWNTLCEIPYGKVITYGKIAKIVADKMNKPRMSAQAIGGAVGHNPISIIIPCHRVVGATGSLTGYSGGIDKKIKLLEHEGVDVSKLYKPVRGTAQA
jgi:methylated-DNA-[protein]-cysteine S-methyltransferase